MKKMGLILIGIIGIVIIGAILFYNISMSSVSSVQTPKLFIIEAGTSKKEVAKNLEKAGLIKSSLALDIYLLFNKNLNLQAGEYELSESMKPEEMIKKFANGDIKINTKKVTLLEGKNLEDFASTLGSTYDFSKQDFLDVVDNEEFVLSMIDEHWFIQGEVLKEGIYHPLEGYLYPDTYEFKETVTAKEVAQRLLNRTEEILEPYKSEIEASEYSVHDLLTLASIVEKEANSKEDRKMAAQVFYTRLKDNWSLGSDVTTYYGVHKQMGDTLTIYDILDSNPYNTRLTDGTMNGKLPIGPICNVNITSVEAALHPSDTSYYYFVANVCTGEVFFQKTNDEFLSKVKELQLTCAQN